MGSVKEILFSVAASDCRFDYYKGSGSGGQARNKGSSATRCTHLASGAVGKSEEGRSQLQNKKRAFGRMATSKEFKAWHRIETSRRMGTQQDINKKVEEEMKKIRIEGKKDGKWVKLDDT